MVNQPCMCTAVWAPFDFVISNLIFYWDLFFTLISFIWTGPQYTFTRLWCKCSLGCEVSLDLNCGLIKIKHLDLLSRFLSGLRCMCTRLWVRLSCKCSLKKDCLICLIILSQQNWFWFCCCYLDYNVRLWASWGASASLEGDLEKCLHILAPPAIPKSLSSLRQTPDASCYS